MPLLRWRPFVALFLACVLALPGGTALAEETRVQGIAPKPPVPTGILINIPALTMYWYQDGKLVRTFPISTGAPEHPTPEGTYKILLKAKDPWWQPPWGGPVVPPGPDNALGTRWMEFYDGNGIHGTPWRPMVGVWTSWGCVRMYKEDVEWLYDQVDVGTTVTIIYDQLKILFDSNGRRYLGVYGDPYSKGQSNIRMFLANAGVDPDSVYMSGPGLYPIDGPRVAVHGNLLPSVLHEGKEYVAARRLAEEIGAELIWDEATSSVHLDATPVPTTLVEGVGYVDARQAAEVLGVWTTWDQGSWTLFLRGRPVYVDGKLIARTGHNIGGEEYLPLRVVAEALGQKVSWDGEQVRALLNGEPIPGLLYLGRWYVSADTLASRLGRSWRLENQAIYLAK